MQTEDLKIDREDLEFNVDKFKSGESNILLITGFVGSGKSTLAAELAEKYNAQHLQLDCFTEYAFGELTKEELDEQAEVGLLAYIEETNLEGGQEYDNYEEEEIVEMIRDYLKFLINWCAEQEEKYIIEGMSIYDVFQEGDDFITSCPMIIKGTSGETSTKQAAERNIKFDKENNFDSFDWYDELSKYIDTDNKKLTALEKEMALVEEFNLYNSMW